MTKWMAALTSCHDDQQPIVEVLDEVRLVNPALGQLKVYLHIGSGKGIRHFACLITNSTTRIKTPNT